MPTWGCPSVCMGQEGTTSLMLQFWNVATVAQDGSCVEQLSVKHFSVPVKLLLAIAEYFNIKIEIWKYMPDS